MVSRTFDKRVKKGRSILVSELSAVVSRTLDKRIKKARSIYLYFKLPHFGQEGEVEG